MVEDPFAVKDGAEAVAQLLSLGLIALGWLSGVLVIEFTTVRPVPFLVSQAVFVIGVIVNDAVTGRVAKRAGLKPFRRWSFLITAFSQINNRRRLREAFALTRSNPGVILAFLEDFRWVLVAAVAVSAILNVATWIVFGPYLFGA